jgi:hypothetical protein
MKLIGMSMIFYCERPRLYLPKYNGSSVVSIKQNMNFNFRSHLYVRRFWFFKTMISLKVVHLLNIYQHTKLHGPTLTCASFGTISEVSTSAIFECLELRD